MPTNGTSPFGAGGLEEALEELERIDEEAGEEGYPPVSDQAKSEARRLLHAAGTFPVEPSVYPSIDGGVAIYFKSPTMPSAILVLVENSGHAACYASIRDKMERKAYRNSLELPDEFLETRLRSLCGFPRPHKPGE